MICIFDQEGNQRWLIPAPLCQTAIWKERLCPTVAEVDLSNYHRPRKSRLYHTENMLIPNNPTIRKLRAMGQTQAVGLLQNLQSLLGRMQSLGPLLKLAPLSSQAECWNIFSAPVWPALGRNLFMFNLSRESLDSLNKYLLGTYKVGGTAWSTWAVAIMKEFSAL